MSAAIVWTRQILADRYLKGEPLTRAEISSLAREKGGAPPAMQAIALAREDATAACHAWEPAEPVSSVSRETNVNVSRETN
jgi:hypothetical protein